MKATIDLDDALYRRLKIEAARRGRTVRDLVAEGIRAVVDAPPRAVDEAPRPAEWFGALAAYGGRAETHDLAAIRASVARARKRRTP
jgi:plasmid stability protein